jgi:hypothetical protein
MLFISRFLRLRLRRGDVREISILYLWSPGFCSLFEGGIPVKNQVMKSVWGKTQAAGPSRHRSTLMMMTVGTLFVVGAVAVSMLRAKTDPVVQINPVDLYGAAATGQIYSPFELKIDPMERLLLVNFSDDPDEIYIGFEPQFFDDAIHGRGMLVIAWRVDGRVDVYHQPGLTLDPDTYGIAGKGLAQMLERSLEDARFVVGADGVDAYFAFDDALGRPIEVTILERNRRVRKPFGLLAPMGEAATSPPALPLVLLHDFYFVRQADTEISIRVAGEQRQPDTLPLPIDGARMYFTRYSPDPLIATLNPAHSGPLTPLERVSPAEARAGDLRFDLVENHGYTEIAQMRRAFKAHEVTVAFSPPIPHLMSLADGVQSAGRVAITADPSVGTVTGEYHIARQGNQIQMSVMPSGGWQPNESKWSVRLIYTLASTFTKWPQSYLWTATLDLADPQQVSMDSGWKRMK